MIKVHKKLTLNEGDYPGYCKLPGFIHLEILSCRTKNIRINKVHM